MPTNLPAPEAATDSLAAELAEMSESVRLDFVRSLIAAHDRMSDLHAQACDREDKAVELAAQWQESYEAAQRKLDEIGRVVLGEQDR